MRGGPANGIAIACDRPRGFRAPLSLLMTKCNLAIDEKVSIHVPYRCGASRMSVKYRGLSEGMSREIIGDEGGSAFGQGLSRNFPQLRTLTEALAVADDRPPTLVRASNTQASSPFHPLLLPLPLTAPPTFLFVALSPPLHSHQDGLANHGLLANGL